MGHVKGMRGELCALPCAALVVGGRPQRFVQHVNQLQLAGLPGPAPAGRDGHVSSNSLTAHLSLVMCLWVCLVAVLAGSSPAALQGVMGMSWCPQDHSLLLSCSKDHRTICWDVSTTDIVCEMPTQDSWSFDVQVCGRQALQSTTSASTCSAPYAHQDTSHQSHQLPSPPLLLSLQGALVW